MFERPEMYGVPAAPNDCVVRGRLERVGPGPGGQGRAWELKVEETDDVEGRPNFARSRLGDVVSVLVPPGQGKGFKKGDRVEARLTYEGDERGGSFFLCGGEARKL
jgi:hypothetical protein